MRKYKVVTVLAWQFSCRCRDVSSAKCTLIKILSVLEGPFNRSCHTKVDVIRMNLRSIHSIQTAFQTLNIKYYTATAGCHPVNIKAYIQKESRGVKAEALRSTTVA